MGGVVMAVISLVRDGSWLTGSRLRVYPAMLLVAFAGALIWLALGVGSKPWNGSDFAGFWVTASLAAEGRFAAIYDPALLQRLLESIIGGPWYQNWPYPPIYLLLVLPLGLLPYWWAFLIWEGAGLAIYWLALGRLVGRDGFLLALAFPGVWIGILNGHAEFMLAGLLGAALLRLDDRPCTAGALIGFCAIKPHLFLLVPVALIAGAQWRAILAACITIVAIAALSVATLGPEPWRAFLGEVAGMGGGIGAAEGPFYLIAAKQQSAFAFGASIGGLKAALILQTVVMLVAAVTVTLVWHRSHALDIRAMVLCCATLLATPYVFDYDLALLAVPIALVARRGMQDGFRPWEKSLLAALWILPFIARPASIYHLPITPILLGLALAIFARPLASASQTVAAPQPAASLSA